MRKLLIAVGISLIGSGLWASCMGPYCWDDTGATIGGYAYNGNGQALVVLSSTSISTLTPYIGQEVLCNSCNNAGKNRYGVCIATATAAPSFVMVSSTTQSCQ